MLASRASESHCPPQKRCTDPVHPSNDPGERAGAKRQRGGPRDGRESRFDALEKYLRENVRLVAMASHQTVFHGGLIPAETARGLGFAKDSPAWFSFDAGHSLEYAFKEPGKVGSLTSFKTTRSLLILDLRFCAYEPTKPRRSTDVGSDGEDSEEGGGDAGGDVEEGDSERDSEEGDDDYDGELLLHRFRDIQRDCCEEFGCGDSDIDLAALIREVVADRKLSIDGIISLDYGTYTELILFEPSAVLAFHEAYDPATQPQKPGFDYAMDSLFGQCFERLCITEKRPGNILAHAVSAVQWNIKCGSKAISDEQHTAFVLEHGTRIAELELATL